jgi:hypothetical protein
MDQDYPDPPPELVQQWWEEADQHVDCDDPETYFDYVATQAARWGADQELEACCEFLRSKFWIESELVDELRAARRPKALGLKEQALEELDRVDMLWDTSEFGPSTLSSLDTIRRALEQLDD